MTYQWSLSEIVKMIVLSIGGYGFTYLLMAIYKPLLPEQGLTIFIILHWIISVRVLYSLYQSMLECYHEVKHE